MSLLQTIRDYAKKPGALRQAFLILIGMTVLAGVILFSANIQNLFRSDDSHADTRTWTELTGVVGGKDRPLGSLVKVTEGGSDWLYAIGGIDIYTEGVSTKRARLHNSVQKLPLQANGMPTVGAVWQDVAPMNSGHAAFAVHQQDGYLYVVAGDIHVPGSLSSTEYGLLYSTMERLKLNQPGATWEVVGLLSGVNFYPEVTRTSDGKFHIIGGVYGNALKDFLSDEGVNGTAGQPADPLNLIEDQTRWPGVSSKPVIGGPIKTTGPIHGDTSGGTNGGGTIVVPGPGGGLNASGLVLGDLIAQGAIIPPVYDGDAAVNPSEILVRDLQSGSFVTTVSEHFRMRLNPSGTPVTEISAGELGQDYTGTTVSERSPTLNQVFKIGPVRMIIRGTGFSITTQYPSNNQQVTAANHRALPVPQGRYGHKLVTQGNQITVLGGASWQTPYTTGTTNSREQSNGQYNYETATSSYLNFWTIEDAAQPLTYSIAMPGGIFGIEGASLFFDYTFVGSTAYKWNGTAWSGTNSTLTNGTAGTRLDSSYALKSADYSTNQGRSFFGWNSFAGTPNNLAEGGLHNIKAAPSGFGDEPKDYDKFSYNCSHPENPIQFQCKADYYRITNTPTDRADMFGGSSWASQPAFNEAVYNPQSGTLQNLGSHSAGQRHFQPAAFGGGQFPLVTATYDAHVPRSNVTGYTGAQIHSSATAGFNSTWSNFPTIPGTVTAFGPSTTINTSSSAVNYGLIYRQDGPTLKVFGPLEAAIPGMPYGPKSTFEVSKNVVFADGLDFSTATITLKDYDGNIVGSNNNPHAVHVSLIVGNPTPDWPQDPANLSVKFTRDQGLAPDAPIASFWAKPNDQGIVSFKVSSSVAQTANLRAVWSTPGDYAIQKQTGSLGPKNVNFVAAPQSTLVAVPGRVLPNGVEASIVTATLRDNQGNALPNYIVTLTSSRGGTDTIVPDTGFTTPVKTNSAGVAKFKITSTTRGYATLTGKYGIVGQPENQYQTIPQTPKVQFAGKIISLTPSFGEQGITYPELRAIGNHTAWKQGQQTTVQMVRPSTLTFRYIKSDGTNVDPASMRFTVDRAIHHFTITASDQPDTQLKLKKLSGFGNFWPETDSNELFVTTDSQGMAHFYFQTAGQNSEAGLVKLQVTIGEADEDIPLLPTKEMWLMVDPNLPSSSYFLKVMSDPTDLTRTNQNANVRAAIYQRIGNTEKLVLPQSPVTVKFGADDAFDASKVVPANPQTNSVGVASAIYTRGNSNGAVHVYAETTYNGLILSGVTSLNKTGNDTGGGITFGTPNIISDTEIVLPNLAVGATTQVGVWMFRAITSFANGYVEVTDHPFLVVPSLASRNPIITSVTPNITNRNVNNLDVTITGNVDTFFTQAGDPAVVFTPVLGGDASKITVTFVSATQTQVKVRLSIHKDAPAGYWNVKVIGGETVEMPGNFDFLVTGPNGYILDTTVDPDTIARDGIATALVTAKVGIIDPFDGSFDLLQTLVTFAKDPARSDTGDALVGVNPVTSDAQGIARINFRSDVGTENKDSYVTAQVVINGVTVIDDVKVTKSVNLYNFALALDRNDLPLRGNPNTVRLTATVTRPDGTKVPNVDVTFETIPSTSDITPAVVRADANGVAASSYIRPNNLPAPTVIKVRAFAIIPGVGKIYSQTKDIAVGYLESDYTITLTSDKSSVAIGGSDFAILTATLKRQNVEVRDWPIAFAFSQSALGDRIEIVRGTTDAQGQATAKFFAGNIQGGAIIKATPGGMQKFGTVTVTKGAGTGDIDTNLSTISAVPKFVPADGIATSRITVSLYDASFRPIVGRTVVLGSSRPGDVISPTSKSAVTDAYGKALFTIKSSTEGDPTVTATIGTTTMSTLVHFVNGANLLTANLKLFVPLEAKSYDRLVKVIMKRTGATEADIEEVYVTSAADEIELPTLYLQKNATYKVWAKGRNHLARLRDVTTSATAVSPTRVDFTETHRNTPNKGLLVSDVQPEFQVINGNQIFLPFHDNKINTPDFSDFLRHWLEDFELIDFNNDHKINNPDLLYWFTNYGEGAATP